MAHHVRREGALAVAGKSKDLVDLAFRANYDVIGSHIESSRAGGDAFS